MKRHILSRFVVLFTAIFGATVAAENRYALTIGVETYDPGTFENLQYAEDDAIRVGQALKRVGYDATIMVSTAKSSKLRPAVARNIVAAVQNAADKCEKSDTLIVSLSGHGVQFKDEQELPGGVKETYFCPEAADLGDKSTLVPVSHLMAIINNSRARRKLLLIDSCRNQVISKDALSKAVAARIELETVHESRHSVPGGMAVLFSCQSDEVSWEAKDLGHSVFSHFVAEYLMGKAEDRYYEDRDMMLDGLVLYVRKKTNDYVFENNLSNQGQYPVVRGTGANWSLGDFRRLSFVIDESSARKEVEQAERWLRNTEEAGRAIAEAVVRRAESRLEYAKSKGGDLLWKAQLGSETYATPVVADGRVFIGTNNGAGYLVSAQQDAGVLLCFAEETGEFLWQLRCRKLESGRINDWPQQGIVSRPEVEGDRLWVLTNRCELVCLDTNGFRDGENDGSTAESSSDRTDADIVWSLDLIGELGVFPYWKAVSDPVIAGDLVIVATANGFRDDSTLEVANPRAPMLVAANKHTGKVVWQWTQEAPLYFGSWSSPALGSANGKPLLVFGAGDGWLYGLDAKTGRRIWKFELYPKSAVYQPGGYGERVGVIAKPVFIDGSVVIGTGGTPEDGDGIGHLWRIDPTRTGDVSAELGPRGRPGKPNPNSAVIWHVDGNVKSTVVDSEGAIHRTLSTPVRRGDELFIADFWGALRSIDWQTGQERWGYDLFSAVWSSPILVDDQILLCDEDGEVTVIDPLDYQAFAREDADVQPDEYTLDSSIYATPVVTKDAIYIATRKMLYKFRR